MLISPQARRLLGQHLLGQALALTLLAAAGPALAQTPGRSISATGRTMPPPRPSQSGDATAKESTESKMIKAQKATEARSKAWDEKMHKTMGTICNGC